jgi:autotransporter-associated beta strand protein
VNGLPYDSTVADYSHSSDLLTLQEIYQVSGQTPTGALGAVAGATSLANLFQPGAIPGTLPTPPAPLSWTDSSGNQTWNSAISANWSASGAPIPFFVDDDVSFTDSNAGDYHVTVSGAVDPSAIDVSNSAGNYIFSGSGAVDDAGSLTKSGSGTLTLDTTGIYSKGLLVNGGRLIAAVPNAMENGALHITGATVQIARNVGTMWLNWISIADSGRLDITNNTVILSHGSADPIASIKQYIESGEIGSSVAADESGYAVGYADGADGVVAGLAKNQIEFKYTLLGDVTLDGTVSILDLDIVESDLGKRVTGWDQGDFYGTGVVTFEDLEDVIRNFGKTIARVTSTASVDFGAAMGAVQDLSPAAIVRGEVPEPASLGILGAAAVALFARQARP